MLQIAPNSVKPLMLLDLYIMHGSSIISGLRSAIVLTADPTSYSKRCVVTPMGLELAHQLVPHHMVKIVAFKRAIKIILE